MKNEVPVCRTKKKSSHESRIRLKSFKILNIQTAKGGVMKGLSMLDINVGPRHLFVLIMVLTGFKYCDLLYCDVEDTH